MLLGKKKRGKQASFGDLCRRYTVLNRPTGREFSVALTFSAKIFVEFVMELRPVVE